MTERELQKGVIDCARLFGWRVAHFRPAQTQHGWRTPVEADGAGFPDLVLVRGDRLIFAELKGDGGKLSDQQTTWLGKLMLVKAVETYIWRPEDWKSGQIERILSPPGVVVRGAAA